MADLEHLLGSWLLWQPDSTLQSHRWGGGLNRRQQGAPNYGLMGFTVNKQLGTRWEGVNIFGPILGGCLASQLRMLSNKYSTHITDPCHTHFKTLWASRWSLPSGPSPHRHVTTAVNYCPKRWPITTSDYYYIVCIGSLFICCEELVELTYIFWWSLYLHVLFTVLFLTHIVVLSTYRAAFDYLLLIIGQVAPDHIHPNIHIICI